MHSGRDASRYGSGRLLTTILHYFDMLPTCWAASRTDGQDQHRFTVGYPSIFWQTCAVVQVVVDSRQAWSGKQVSAGMGTVGAWLQIQYCVLYMLLCNYLTKEVAACFPGGQGSDNIPYRPIPSIALQALSRFSFCRGVDLSYSSLPNKSAASQSGWSLATEVHVGDVSLQLLAVEVRSELLGHRKLFLKIKQSFTFIVNSTVCDNKRPLYKNLNICETA